MIPCSSKVSGHSEWTFSPFRHYSFSWFILLSVPSTLTTRYDSHVASKDTRRIQKGTSKQSTRDHIQHIRSFGPRYGWQMTQITGIVWEKTWFAMVFQNFPVDFPWFNPFRSSVTFLQDDLPSTEGSPPPATHLSSSVKSVTLDDDATGSKVHYADWLH